MNVSAEMSGPGGGPIQTMGDAFNVVLELHKSDGDNEPEKEFKIE